MLMRIASRLGMRLGVLKQHAPRPVRSLRLPPAPRSLENVPTISVVTPVRNLVGYVEATLRSVLDQGYPTLEYVVMDGGSTDGTAEIISRYRSKLVHYESGPDGGQTNAINKGFLHTSGEIMAWLNADDLFLPGSLPYVGAYFRDHPDVDVIYGHRLLLDHHGNEIGRWVMPPHEDAAYRWIDFVAQETMFWRRSSWDKLKAGLDASLHFTMDWDFILRLHEAGARFARVPFYLGAFRISEDQKTLDLSGARTREIHMLLDRCAKDTDWRRLRTRALTSYILKHIVTDRYYQLRGWA
jgi:glycosyltransferase involved in cell wall biosynthesis